MVARIRAVPTWGRFAKLCGVLVGAVSLCIAMTASALAQNSPFVTVTPTKNTGGFVYGLAVIMSVLGVLIVVAVAGAYLRYAPRFQRDEGATAVRAARVVPGREPPRRAVDVSQAAPVVVAPPAVAAPAHRLQPPSRRRPAPPRRPRPRPPPPRDPRRLRRRPPPAHRPRRPLPRRRRPQRPQRRRRASVRRSRSTRRSSTRSSRSFSRRGPTAGSPRGRRGVRP